jgi:hypothetical protein
MAVGSTVTLTREPCIDTDQNDRALRYVPLAGGSSELGPRRVYQRHISGYEGDNDASDAYVAELRRLDQPNEADGAVALKRFYAS